MTCVLPTLITADTDIPILKVGVDQDDKMISPYQKFSYGLREVYKIQPLKLEFTGKYYLVSEGFHSYHPGEVQLYEEFWAVIVAKGGLREETYPAFMSVFEGFIPAGAHYYLNMRGEIVSDQICITNRR